MPKIFINAGHGGNDPGAVGNGLREADVALAIGQHAEHYLRAVGYDVKLFQYDGLQAICDDANSFHADLFVSIHCNAATANAKGTETYCCRGATSGRKLAEAIHKQITSSLPIVNRGVKEAGFFVLANTNMPAVLVETAFIDNPDDAKFLRDNQDDFARAIARGITDYYSTQKPLPDVADVPKATTSGLSKHFDVSEFVCHCCGRGADKIDPRLIELLEQLRVKADAPIHVNCGYRCPKHNADVGGVPNSQHVLGSAADIYIPALTFNQAHDLVKTLPFDGTGFYPPVDSSGLWFIHVDTRQGGVNAGIEWWE